jgi:hypothetical protein
MFESDLNDIVISWALSEKGIENSEEQSDSTVSLSKLHDDDNSNEFLN